MLPVGNLDEMELPVPLHPGYRPTVSSVHYTTSCKHSSAPEDGRNCRQKHVELIGIFNKPLLLHLVGCQFIVSAMHGRTNIESSTYMLEREICRVL